MKLKEKLEAKEETHEVGLENTYMDQDDRSQSDDASQRGEDFEKDDVVGESKRIPESNGETKGSKRTEGTKTAKLGRQGQRRQTSTM